MKWSDAKTFIFEDILIFGGTILFDLGFDCIFNFLHSLGLIALSRPAHIGIAQIVVAVFFSVLLARKLEQWKYYA